MNYALGAFLSAGLALLASTAAHAEPKAIAAFKDWDVLVEDTSTDRICFAAARAADKSPKSVNHGDIFFLVATWKSGASKNQPNLRVGYNLKDSPAPTIRIGSRKWEMYVSENEAFIEKSADEQSLIAAMRQGAEMRVNAMSSRGTATSYIISLDGVSAALDKVAEACK